MATGEAPFGGESTVAVLRKVSDDAPQPVRDLNPDVPAWLARIIERLMAKDPAKRYQAAAEVADLLSSELASVQRPGGMVAKPEAPPASHRYRGGWGRQAVALAVPIIIVGIVAGGLMNRSSRMTPVRHENSPSITARKPDLPPAEGVRPVEPPKVPSPPPAAPERERLADSKTSDRDWLVQGRMAFQRADYKLAVQYLSEALRRNHDLIPALLTRAEAKRYLNDRTGALVDYGEAIRIDPKGAGGYFGRSGVEADMGDFELCLTDVNEALRLEPKLTWAHYGRGRAYEGLMQWDRAIEDFTLFIKEVPDFAPSRHERAICYTARNDLSLALEDSNLSVQLNDRNFAFRHFRAWLRARTGDYDGAISDYSMILRLDPNSVDKLSDRACAYALAGKHKEAEADFDAALRGELKVPWPRLRRAHNLYMRRGEFDRAIDDCNALIAVKPDMAEAYFYRGLAYLGKNDYAHAAADLDQALKLDQPESLTFQGPMRLRYPELYDARASARERLGNAEGAESDRAEAKRLRAAIQTK